MGDEQESQPTEVLGLDQEASKPALASSGQRDLDKGLFPKARGEEEKPHPSITFQDVKRGRPPHRNLGQGRGQKHH